MDRTFDCRDYEKTQSAYLDGQLPVQLKGQVDAHLRRCTKCREQAVHLGELRNVLRTMPRRAVPPKLTTNLRIVASRERARREHKLTRWQEFVEDFRLWKENLMRPFAIPAAGGFVSAILLFCIIAPSLIARNVGRTRLDVPTGLYTEASIKGVLPLGFDGEEVDLELTIDENGNMVDYTMVEDTRHEFARNPGLMRNLESHLLTMKFTPATAFGQPVGAKIRLTFRNTRIDVRG